MHSIELCTDNYRLYRFLVLMKSLNPSRNVRSSVFLKSYRVDSETKEGVLHDVVWALSGVLTNLTASQISAQISWEIARTCRTSRQQSLADCVNRSAVEGRDRVGDDA